MGDFNDCLPFERGSTYNCESDETAALHLEGREFTVYDDDLGTNEAITLRVVRNRSGATLGGKRVVQYATVPGKFQVEVSGYAATNSVAGHVADDQYGAAAIPDKDLFYVVVKGPVLVKTPLEGTALNVFAVGDRLHALTAATTGATTAGRVQAAILTGATAPLVSQIAALIGTAMSAKTTGNTNADLLVYAGRF